jgi:glucose-6-phosphate 1-dehydrogenase
MHSPFVIVIFGATGDLAQHKLLPALYSLYKKKVLGEKFYIVGFARRDFSDTAYRSMITEELSHQNEPEWGNFIKNLYYQQGLFDEETGYNALITKLNGFDTEIGACITRMFYLATPPDNYETILKYLHSTKLSEGCGQGSEKWTRLAIEKPFGKDLDTARSLDTLLATIFEERQIYRVDHYLGKETMQNILAFRFANSIFESVWNKDHIDHVQVTWAEAEGIKNRGNFFDGIGILRDVGQNHLLQMLAAVAMEQPESFSKEAVRDARANAIKAIRMTQPSEVERVVVRGQYAGYQDEKYIADSSQTETFIAAKLFVKTPRFDGVPFYVRAGKKMQEERMDIKIIFKQNSKLFQEYTDTVGNVLTIRIQPDEGINLQLLAKKPFGSVQGDRVLHLDPVDMRFSYRQSFGSNVAAAYEKILLDILAGDQMLFNRSDELDSSWQLISNILQGWEQENEAITSYEQGSWGPDAATTLIEKDGRKWL